MCLAAVTSDSQHLGIYLNVDCQKSAVSLSQHQRSHGATVALPSAQRLNLAQGVQCNSRKAGVSSLYHVCALVLYHPLPSGLIPFLNNVTCPVLASNLDLSEEPLLAATPLANSTILVVNGTRIGVIGYLTPDTKLSFHSGDQLWGHYNVSYGISGHKMMQLTVIYRNHPDWQSRTALPVTYCGNQPDLEVPESLYPHVVTQSSGRKIPVVQAYAYTKYLGQLDLVFDEHGEIISNKGNPILLDSSVTRDIEALQNTVVGRTKVLLDGDRKNCRLVECNMGNLITDAMIDEDWGSGVYLLIGIQSTVQGAPPSASLVNAGTIFSARPLSEECERWFPLP
uniref:5'-nucleotidase n=1 Tax=Timema cristinae TaxID=61476 RepID=A0A7R9H2B4_TIMCR|nr:unnamed protein product [Timema cristinae]